MMRAKDVEALLPFYEEVLKIYQELRVVFFVYIVCVHNVCVI